MQIVSTSNPRPPHLLLCVAAASLLVGCDAPQTRIAGPAAPPADVHRYIAPGAAASLNADGRFMLAVPSAPDDRPIITLERAGELALASVRTWGPSLHRSWERDSGRAIDLASLRVGPRILFARTPYGRFPDGYHPAFARTYGPYYLVTLYAGSDPVVLVSVAAYNTEARIDEKGLVHRPMNSGAEFISMGLRAGSDRFQMVSPEAAVEEVGRATGARVTATPELVRLGMPYAPATAAWKVSLDREVPVHARAGGTTHRVRELYVSPVRTRRLLMAARRSDRIERISAIANTPDDRIDQVDVPILAGEAVSFEPVEILHGGPEQ